MNMKEYKYKDFDKQGLNWMSDGLHCMKKNKSKVKHHCKQMNNIFHNFAGSKKYA